MLETPPDDIIGALARMHLLTGAQPSGERLTGGVSSDIWRIDLPSGGYVPVFTRFPAAAPEAAPELQAGDAPRTCCQGSLSRTRRSSRGSSSSAGNGVKKKRNEKTLLLFVLHSLIIFFSRKKQKPHLPPFLFTLAISPTPSTSTPSAASTSLSSLVAVPLPPTLLPPPPETRR